MKKLLAILCPVALGATIVACTTSKAEEAAPVEVNWSTVNLTVDSGPAMYRQTFTVTGDLRGVQRLAFNQFARGMHPANPEDTLIELFPGYYAIGSSRFAQATGNDTLVFEILTRGNLNSICYGPDGVHTVKADGTVGEVNLTRTDLLDNPDSYGLNGRSKMPKAADVYATNQGIYSADTAAVYDVVPSFKSVTLTGGVSDVNLSDIEYKALPAGVCDKPEAYRISIGEGKVVVEAPEALWKRIGMRIAHFFGTGERMLPDAVIVDYPDYEYRGLMLDVSRNFQTPEEIHRVLELMALYGLNTFHFHLTDDEGWRIEIKGLPELTEIGSVRGYTTADGTDPFLPQIYGRTPNGYFTQDEYIAILQHADSLGINVIPEIESPGHARAAIIAMEHRAARTGDDSWLLSQPGDSSVYTSAQAYHDNIMNPAMEGPYKLMNLVADELIDMHKRAGVPLKAIHIGGDEVPRNAWGGSSLVADLMAKEGLENEKEVHAYFVKKVRKNFADKGMKIAGWQEIATGHSDEYNAEVAPDVYAVNCWSTLPRPGQKLIPVQVGEGGYPVLLSNVESFYLDMCYNTHPMERGLTWGGTVDEYNALHGYPAIAAPGQNVLGLQGQVWAETIRGPENLEVMLLPKMLGLAERAWNGEKTYSDPQFQAVINEEMPKWDAAGYAYHVRQPGIRVADGRYVSVNSPYRDATVRVTFDGTNPDENSLVLPADSVLDIQAYSSRPSEIRARLWVNGHPSFVTVENLAE